MNIKCFLGLHKAGRTEAAVGGRNVVRCAACKKILKEESIMDKVRLGKPPRAKGRGSDSWFKG